MIQRLKHHLMAKSRAKKIREFISLTGDGKDSTILDVGAANKEYSPYDNPLEKIYAYSAKITALSIYPLDEFSKRYPEIRAVNYMGGSSLLMTMNFLLFSQMQWLNMLVGLRSS